MPLTTTDGRLICAVASAFAPDHIKYEELDLSKRTENIKKAIEALEKARKAIRQTALTRGVDGRGPAH